MNRKVLFAVAAALVLGGLGGWILNRPLTTRQGVNYRQTTRTIPAYVKVLDFVQRHYQYKLIASNICANATSSPECMLLDEGWIPVDVEHQLIFRDAKGTFLTVDALLRDPRLIDAATDDSTDQQAYRTFISRELLDPFVVPAVLRAELPQPWPRLKYEAEKAIGVVQ